MIFFKKQGAQQSQPLLPQNKTTPKMRPTGKDRYPVLAPSLRQPTGTAETSSTPSRR